MTNIHVVRVLALLQSMGLSRGLGTAALTTLLRDAEVVLKNLARVLLSLLGDVGVVDGSLQAASAVRWLVDCRTSGNVTNIHVVRVLAFLDSVGLSRGLGITALRDTKLVLENLARVLLGLLRDVRIVEGSLVARCCQHIV